MLEPRTLRVLLVGAEKVGKSYFFDKLLDTVRDEYDDLFLQTEIWEEEGVRKFEKTYHFAKGSVTVHLVDIDETGLAVREIQQKNQAEREKAEAVIFIYSMLRRPTFRILEEDLIGPTTTVLKKTYGDQKLEVFPFILYGTEKDKLDITEDKSSANVVSEQEALALCLKHDGMFALQNSSLHTATVDKIVKDLILDTFKVQGISLEGADQEKRTNSNTGFLSRFRSRSARKKKNLNREEDA